MAAKRTGRRSSERKGKARDPERETRWRKVLTAWEGSGQSIRGYCREHGITEASFYFWRRELRLREAEAAQRSTAAFVPVRLKAETPAGCVPNMIELMFNGLTLRVPAHTGTDRIRELVAALDGESC
jgi:hypothetical protein